MSIDNSSHTPIFNSKKEAEVVVRYMREIIDNYDMVSVADLKELIGMPSTHMKTYVDNKWGWTNLTKVKIRKIRNKNLYSIKFPPAEPI